MASGNRERGIATIVFTVLIMAIIGFAAMGLDIGLLYSQRTQLQRAADAAALAGAFTFVVEPFASQPSTATEHALSVAASNTIDKSLVNPGEVTVNVDTANRRVTVNLAHAESTVLAAVLGTKQVTINVTAVAEAGPAATNGSCVKPWFVPNTIVDTKDDPCTACTKGQLMIQNGALTSYAQAFIQAKQPFTLKPQQPSNAIGPGQFYAIQFPGSGGGSDYSDNIAHCNPLPIVCANYYSVETGNMSGPTVQGTQAMIGYPNQDVFVNLGQYASASGTISDTSRSLAIAPIWDDCNLPSFCPGNSFGNGTKVNVQVIGFALVFVDSVQGGNVIAHLINVLPCSAVTPPAAAPYAIPVRLVRTN